MTPTMSDDDDYYERARASSPTRRATRSATRTARGSTSSRPRATGRASPSRSCRRTASEVARVRTAWNVLSDPFQRQRYDAQLAGRADGDVDDRRRRRRRRGRHRRRAHRLAQAAGAAAAEAARRNGARRRGNGDGAAAGAPRRPRSRRSRCPPGMQLAEPPAARHGDAVRHRHRCCVIFIGDQLPASRRDPERLPDNVEQIDKVSTLRPRRTTSTTPRPTRREDDRDRRRRRDDGQGAPTTKRRQPPKRRTDERRRTSDDEAGQNAEEQDRRRPPSVRRQDDLRDDIAGTQLDRRSRSLVLALLYLVPSTARTGQTLGMRSRKLKVVRVDGQPVGWWPVVRCASSSRSRSRSCC